MMKLPAAVDTSLLRYSMAGEVPGKVPTCISIYRPPWGLSVSRFKDEPEQVFWERVAEVADDLRKVAVRAGFHPLGEPMWLTVMCHYDEAVFSESDLLETCRQPLRRLIESPLLSEDMKLRATVALTALTMK